MTEYFSMSMGCEVSSGMIMGDLIIGRLVRYGYGLITVNGANVDAGVVVIRSVREPLVGKKNIEVTTKVR